MAQRRAQRFGGGFWVVVDFAAADDAIKDAEHRRDSDQEAQAAPRTHMGVIPTCSTLAATV